MDAQAFTQAMQAGYQLTDDCITLGAATLDGQTYAAAKVTAPIKMLTRHGVIAGATGTGKTKTIQSLAEACSDAGVSVCLMDLKGDLSGLAQPGSMSEGIQKRVQQIGLNYQTKGFPVELLSLSDEAGVHLRATVSEFGAVLFSRLLDLNDNQSAVVAVAFKYAHDNSLPLLDLEDVKTLLGHIGEAGKDDFERVYGRVASSSLGAILRKIIALEEQGANRFFGEPSFDVQDLMRTDANGQGILSILRLTSLQDRPQLFSCFMVSLLSELYRHCPEVGDAPKPKCLLFIDEAHLLFSNASKVLLQQLEAMVKLIRSKGIGLFFCTQNPNDIPDAILGQCGLKIQHALRAFTAKDRKAIKLAAQNYPDSAFYQTDKVITELGVGEALVSVLDANARPTPLAATLLRPPASRMGVLSDEEIRTLVTNSNLVKKYAKTVDRESAKEKLRNKMKTTSPAIEDPRAPLKKETSLLTELSRNTMVRQMARTFTREVTRALLSIFKSR